MKKLFQLTPYDKTEMSGNTLRNFVDPILHIEGHFNVLEMALKTFHIVQGPSRTPLLFFPRYLTTRFPKHIWQHKKYRKSTIWKSENPQTQVH